MTVRRSPVLAALAGAASWTAAEYLLHRFAMHEMRGRGLASVEHLDHHADITYFTPNAKKVASAAGASVVVHPLATRALGHRRAAAFTGGLLTMYAAYEVAHRRIHTHPPTNRYGRWSRRNHLRHHFGAPRRNYGVTTPVWDRLFRTGGDDGGPVVVPRRMTPTWMLDERGDVRPEFTGDYIVKGQRDVSVGQAERDRADAYANAAPEA